MLAIERVPNVGPLRAVLMSRRFGVARARPLTIVMANVRRADRVLLLFLGFSLTLNVYQYEQPAAWRRSPPEPLKVGQQLPRFVARTLDGKSFRLSYDSSRPTILYAFSPSCSWCARNLANARALARQTVGRFDFVAVALSDDGLEKYVTGKRLDWTIVKDVPDDILSAYRLYGAPSTIVLDAHNTVMYAWSGAFSGNVFLEVERVLAVKLPGLLPVVSPSSAGNQP
jgi:peroxiredoxin